MSLNRKRVIYFQKDGAPRHNVAGAVTKLACIEFRFTKNFDFNHKFFFQKIYTSVKNRLFENPFNILLHVSRMLIIYVHSTFTICDAYNDNQNIVKLLPSDLTLAH